MKSSLSNSVENHNSRQDNYLSRYTAFISIVTGPGQGRHYKLSSSRTLTIGRGDNADIQILDKGLSRYHANLFYRNGKAHIEDSNSTNGTFINKKRFVESRELKHGDKIFLGTSTLIILIIKEFMDESGQEESKPLGLARDPLTNLLDKDGCMKCLEKVCDETKRNASAFCMLMIKIDDYSKVEDDFGAEGGNEVLVQVANILESISREEDYVCHYSKEEFVVICPEYTTFSAIKFAEFIRSKIENTAFMYKSYQIRITTSIGISTYPDGKVQTEAQLIEFAHNAVNHAEKSGKNSTSVAN